MFKDGLPHTFDTWKRAVRNKLRSNADHYPTEEAKLGYVLSRVGQPASDVLEPYLDDEAAVPLATYTQVFETLERVYGVPNEEYMYLKRLAQNNDFSAFAAEGYRLSVERDRLKAQGLCFQCKLLCNTKGSLTFARCCRAGEYVKGPAV